MACNVENLVRNYGTSRNLGKEKMLIKQQLERVTSGIVRKHTNPFTPKFKKYILPTVRKGDVYVR